MTSVDRCSS